MFECMYIALCMFECMYIALRMYVYMYVCIHSYGTEITPAFLPAVPFEQGTCLPRFLRPCQAPRPRGRQASHRVSSRPCRPVTLVEPGSSRRAPTGQVASRAISSEEALLSHHRRFPDSLPSLRYAHAKISSVELPLLKKERRTRSKRITFDTSWLLVVSLSTLCVTKDWY